MPRSLTSYRVFIASPGGLSEERQAFRDVIDKFNESAAIHDGVHFQAVGWEETLGGMGRPQHLINEDLSTCDFFVMLLCDRWGSPSGDANNKYSSGTQEEYEVALDCHNAGTMKQLVVLFKKVDEKQLNDPGPQLQQVIEFKKKIETERTLLFQSFDSVNYLMDLLNKHLQAWLRWGREAVNSTNTTPFHEMPSGPTLAPPLLDTKPSIETSPDSDDTLVSTAWDLANAGKLTEAEIAFAKAFINEKTPNSLIQYGYFLFRIGMLDRAKSMFEESGNLAEQQHDERAIADSYGGLARVYITRNEFDKAEELYRKALLINEKASRLSEMAKYYGNLGIIMSTRGELKEAEGMHRKSLAINEQIDDKRGIASQCGNIGTIMYAHGNLIGAEEMHRKSLAIDEELNDLEGTASDYGNLGHVLSKRGDVDAAKEMYHKSLAISEQLGKLEDISIGYSSLGILLQEQGDLKGAEEMHQKSLAINEKLGDLAGVARNYGNIGIVQLKQDSLDKAEEMFSKSLAINKSLGLFHQIQIYCGKLAGAKMLKEDFAGAEDLYVQALEAARKVGVKSEIEQLELFLYCSRIGRAM